MGGGYAWRCPLPLGGLGFGFSAAPLLQIGHLVSDTQQCNALNKKWWLS